MCPICNNLLCFSYYDVQICLVCKKYVIADSNSCTIDVITMEWIDGKIYNDGILDQTITELHSMLACVTLDYNTIIADINDRNGIRGPYHHYGS